MTYGASDHGVSGGPTSNLAGERREGIMAKGNNARKKETKKPKKGAAKAGPDAKQKDAKKK
jgi:hypothetical protein